MRRAHLERFAPICPLCRLQEQAHALVLHRVDVEEGDDVVHGALVCSRRACQREYPIIDGIPVLLADATSFFEHQGSALLQRTDLPDPVLSMLGDALGDSLGFNVRRQQLSSYGMGHYGDLLGEQASVPGLLEGLLEGIEGPLGAALDIGCGAGRGTLELAARTDDLVLGIDLSVAFLRLARGCRDGTLRMPVRELGVVYRTAEVAVDFEGADRVDFWACDASALPFAEGVAQTALSMNVLDCVPHPYAHLHELGRALGPGGLLLLCSPFDWVSSAVPMGEWLGGHSDRGPHGGQSEPALHRLFDPEQVGEGWVGLHLERVIESMPWRIYMHRRASMDYQVHGVVARKPE